MKSDLVIGIVGGGQLGRMTSLSASKLGFKTAVFTDSADSPACHVTDVSFVGDYQDFEMLAEFAKAVNVVTCEFESVPSQTLSFLEKTLDVLPSSKIFEIAGNKHKEKMFLNSISLPTADWAFIENQKSLNEFINKFGFTVITKQLYNCYDGKGQKIINSYDDIKDIQYPCIVEKLVNFTREISIIICRSKEGYVKTFPVPDNLHKNGILVESSVPSTIGNYCTDMAKEFANRIAQKLDLVGILCIEFFCINDKELLINEIAPRPHNSGHWSMTACNVSQFDQLVNILAGLKLKTIILKNHCTMKNLLGSDVLDAHNKYNSVDSDVFVYGKSTVKPNRKMGHVNILR